MISLRGDHQDSDKHLVFYASVEAWQEKRLPAPFVLYRQLWPFQLAHALTNMTAFLSQNQEWSCIYYAHELHICLSGPYNQRGAAFRHRMCLLSRENVEWSHCSHLSAPLSQKGLHLANDLPLHLLLMFSVVNEWQYVSRRINVRMWVQFDTAGRSRTNKPEQKTAN